MIKLDLGKMIELAGLLVCASPGDPAQGTLSICLHPAHNTYHYHPPEVSEGALICDHLRCQNHSHVSHILLVVTQSGSCRLNYQLCYSHRMILQRQSTHRSYIEQHLWRAVNQSTVSICALYLIKGNTGLSCDSKIAMYISAFEFIDTLFHDSWCM